VSNLSLENVSNWQGRTLVDRDGDKVGSISDIYIDEQSGRPEWALVNTGLFGTKHSFVPISSASEQADQVAVPFEKSQIKNAPTIEPDGALSESEESELYRHYGLDYGSGYQGTTTGTGEGTTTGTYEGTRTGTSEGTAGAGYDTGADAGGTVGRDTSGPTTDQAMTRSEEEVEVGTRQVEQGRARLRKYVVTENVTTTVPVQREEVRLEREPITDANRDAALEGPDISEEEHEVTLRAEEPVVEKRVVPKERVRLDTETVTDERQVSEEVRKEQIQVDDQDQLRRDQR
jgi:uncharacterized protein (TIGR02271 family)